MSTKSELMERTILQHSRHKPFRAAAGEWCLLTVSPTLDGFVSCEACGTPIRKSASIRNEITGATLVIGLTCYDHLLGMMRSIGVRMRLVGRQAFIRSHTLAAEQRVEERYRSYVEGVHVRSWKKWLLSEVPGDREAPDEVRRGVEQLQAFGGIIDGVCLEACISYHDHRRLFPVGALLPEGWRRWFPESPPILTIAQADEIRHRHGRPLPVRTVGPMHDQTAGSAPSHVAELRRLRACLDCGTAFDPGRSKRKVCGPCHEENERIRRGLFGRRTAGPARTAEPPNQHPRAVQKRSQPATKRARLRLCVDCRESFDPGRSKRKVCDRCHAENERIRRGLFGGQPSP